MAIICMSYFVPCLINPILSLSDSRLLNPELRQNWQCKVLLIYSFVIYLNMLVKIYGGMVFVTEFTDPSVKQTEYMMSGEAGIMRGGRTGLSPGVFGRHMYNEFAEHCFISQHQEGFFRVIPFFPLKKPPFSNANFELERSSSV